MSVWHEVQIEFARDALDDIIWQYGTTPELSHLMEIIKEAEEKATDLPEERLAESLYLLEQSYSLLEKAEGKVPDVDEKPYRNLRNKLKKAKGAVKITISATATAYKTV